MSDAQLFAGGFSAVLVVVVVAASIRWRLPSVSAVYALMFAVPALGFAEYAVVGGPGPDLDLAYNLAGILYGLVLILGTSAVVLRIRRRGKPAVWNMATDSRRYAIALAFRWMMVLAISAAVYVFEPAFGIVNVCLNLVWMIAWLPRRFRTRTQRTETEIAAPPKRVFEFVRDVRNWPLYRDDVELIRVSPDGPLAAGSEYVARVVIPESIRRASYRHVESRYRVTSMLPDRAYEVRLLDLSGSVRTELEQTPSGTTRLSRTVQTTMGLLRAWSADALNNPIADAAMRPRERRINLRLKEILEPPPNH